MVLATAEHLHIVLSLVGTGSLADCLIDPAAGFGFVREG